MGPDNQMVIAGPALSTYISRCLWLFPIHLGKQSLQLVLKPLVFSPLIELAHEMPAGFEGLVSEGQCGIAQVLRLREMIARL